MGPPAGGPSEKLKSLKLENPGYIADPQSVYVNTETKEVSYQNDGNGGKSGTDYQSLGPSQQTQRREKSTYTALEDEGAYYKL